jgi:uncharacterized protein (TIGR03435 family)
MAFRIDPIQSDLLSAPDWVRDVRVDINANFPEGSRELVPEMLKTLLADRFGLRASVKPRLPVDTIVVDSINRVPTEN